MAFDRYMIQAGAGVHPKLRELSIYERYIFLIGVLSIAAKADPRGSFTVAGRPATPADLQQICGADVRICRRCVAHLQEMGMLICSTSAPYELVRDWDQWNVNPRSDARNKERQARSRERNVTLRNAVTAAPEVKKLEEKNSPYPLSARNGVTQLRAVNAPKHERTAPARTGVYDELPDLEVWLINNALDELQHRGEPVHAAAIRALVASQTSTTKGQ